MSMTAKSAVLGTPPTTGRQQPNSTALEEADTQLLFQELFPEEPRGPAKGS